MCRVRRCPGIDSVQEPGSDLGRRRSQIDGDEAEAVSLDDGRFVEVVTNGRVEQDTFRCPAQFVVDALGLDVSVELKDVAAVETAGAVKPRLKGVGELGLDDDSPVDPT